MIVRIGMIEIKGNKIPMAGDVLQLDHLAPESYVHSILHRTVFIANHIDHIVYSACLRAMGKESDNKAEQTVAIAAVPKQAEEV